MKGATPATTGYVVSDMHIFGCTSLYERYLPVLYHDVARHSVIVLNGDTFDFKRSRFSNSAETAQSAIAWLRDLSTRAAAGKIFYILGNHDSHTLFVPALSAALPELPNVSLAVDSLRLGSTLFVHGDIVDLPAGTLDINSVRSRYAYTEPYWVSRVVGNTVTHLRLNTLEYLRHSKTSLAERIVEYFSQASPHALDGVRDIYFGHTHVPFTGFQYRGISFHNTGSMIRGLPWRPLEFVVPATTPQP